MIEDTSISEDDTASEDDLAGGSKTCACGGEMWESGWLVFVHTNDDTDGNEICEFDGLLEVHGPLDGSGTTLRGYDDVDDFKYKVSFIYDGSTKSGTFVLCDNRRESHARVIEVGATGRIRTLIATDPPVHSCPP